MGDLVTKLRLDGSDFTRGMNDASKSVEDFKDASKMSASELLNQMKSMDKLGRSTSNYRSQLAQMTRQIQDLRINYQAMSDDMKKSDFGRAVAAKIQEVTAKAAEMRDAIQDASASVKLLSSDTVNLDAFKMGVEGISSAFSLVASTGVLGAESTDKLVKVLARLKAIESATNAVIKISNILNKDSILMLKLKELATIADTQALNANTAATVANNSANVKLTGNLGTVTKSFKGLTTVLKTSKVAKFGVVGAVLALIAAYVKLSSKLREEHQEQMRNIRLTDEQREAFSGYTKEIQSSIGKAAAAFDKLQRAYNGISTDNEKLEYLKEYGTELEKLGVKVNNINDLEEIWSEDGTKKIKKAVMLRAQYLAIQGLAVKKYEEVFNQISEKWASQDSYNYKAGDVFGKSQSNPTGLVPKEKLELNGLVEGVDYNIIEEEYGKVIAQLTASGAAKLKLAGQDLGTEFGIQMAENAAQPFYDMLDSLQRYADANGIDLNLGNNNGGGGNTNPEPEVGSAAYYNKLIDERNKKLQNEVHTQEEILAIQQEITRLEYLRDKALGKNPDGGAISIKPLSLQDVINRDMQNQQIEIPAIANIEGIEFEDVTFADLNKEISNTISGFQSMNNAVSSIGSAVEDLGEGWDENKSDIENITTKIGDMLTIMQSITSVIETINALTKIFDSLQLVGWQLGKKKESQTIAEAGAEATLVGLKAQEAVAGTVAAGAEGAQSASKIPYVGWILAIGAIAAIVAALVAAKSSMNFATGGIVPGMSFGGDQIAAQLNSGEMVLNTQQQRNLFDMLNTGSTDRGGKVEFVIKGQELKGVLNNYDKKMSRV